MSLKFLLNEVFALIIIISCLFSNIQTQAIFHFNPSAPPVYPLGLLPDGTKKRPFLLYASSTTFINMLTAGAPVSELSLKFKAGMTHPIAAGTPLTVIPKLISFTPWDSSPSPNMSVNLTLIGKFPVNASSLVIENCKFKFTPGSHIELTDSVKGSNVILTLKKSEFEFIQPQSWYVKMKSPNMVKIEDVKMKRGSAKDIDAYFLFNEESLTTTEISIKNLSFSGPKAGADTTKNNLLVYTNKVDCRSFEITESDIKIINVVGFFKESTSFIMRKSLVNKTKFENSGLFNFQNSKNGQITVSDFSVAKCTITSARLIQVCLPTNMLLVEKINLIETEFKLGDGQKNQIFSRFILTLEQMKEMHINNWYFSKVKSVYDEDKAPNTLVHTVKPVTSLNIFDVDIPDNFEVGSYVNTFAKVTSLKIDKVKSYFSKGYFDNNSKDAKKGKGKKRNNFISVYSGVQMSEITNITANNNVVQKTSFIIILNAKDYAKFSDIEADGNLISSDEDAKVSFITVLQTKEKLPLVQIKNSKFSNNYNINESKHPNYSSCFTFHGKINSAEVINTKFTDNRSNDINFDNFDITSIKTTLDTMNIISDTEKELKKGYAGIKGNGGAFEIFGRGVFIKKSNILCTSKSPNLKGKMRSYKIKKEMESLIFKKVDDYYRFRC